MFKRVLYLLTAVVLLSVGRVASSAPPIPPPPTERVTDTAGFLSQTARQTLNARLEAYEHASGHQLLVWVGKTTGEVSTEDWTVRAFQAWRVGRKGMDDGLVLFVFAEDRKARIEVGYGLEAQVPDAVASRILSDVIAPRIRAGDPDGAVTAAVDQLISAIGNGGAVPGTTARPSEPLTALQIIGIILAVIVVLLLAIRYPTLAFYLVSAIFSRNGTAGGGGFSGGGGRSGGGGATGRW